MDKTKQKQQKTTTHLSQKPMIDTTACEQFLRSTIGDEQLKVISVSRHSIKRNAVNQVVEFDVFCRLGNGNMCTIPVRKTDNHKSLF